MKEQTLKRKIKKSEQIMFRVSLETKQKIYELAEKYGTTKIEVFETAINNLYAKAKGK